MYEISHASKAPHAIEAISYNNPPLQNPFQLHQLKKLVSHYYHSITNRKEEKKVSYARFPISGEEPHWGL
jgi:hypothetical protein